MTHSKGWWEVREDRDGLKGLEGFQEEVAFELSLEEAFASGEWRGERRWGLQHRTSPRARQV